MNVESKQVADIYFDKEQKFYRAVVEFYFEDEAFGDDVAHKVTVDVTFKGNGTETFTDIEKNAFVTASKLLKLANA